MHRPLVLPVRWQRQSQVVNPIWRAFCPGEGCKQHLATYERFNEEQTEYRLKAGFTPAAGAPAAEGGIWQRSGDPRTRYSMRGRQRDAAERQMKTLIGTRRGPKRRRRSYRPRPVDRGPNVEPGAIVRCSGSARSCGGLATITPAPDTALPGTMREAPRNEGRRTS